MKALYLVRHAKSSWDSPSLDDFSRPLNKRGQRDIPRMAKRLKEKEPVLDLIISSPANRALTTAQGMADILQYDKSLIRQEPKLYHASPEIIFDAVKKLSDKSDTIMLVGHNPGLTEFVNELATQSIVNIPTCGIAAIELPATEWKAIQWQSGKLLFFNYPKATVD